jgi:hypothetical protein
MESDPHDSAGDATERDATISRVLRDEFGASPGSFLLTLRCNLEWNEHAFNRLTQAMFEYVRTRNRETDIPRWIAEGFWYLDWFVKDWSMHESFPREHDESYYEAAYERLHDLAYWLFVGESIHQR